MLVQDTLTGALHEVPEVAGYGYYGEPAETMGEVYDGFGNPRRFPAVPCAARRQGLPGYRTCCPGSPRRFPVSGNSSTDSCLVAERLLPRRPCKPCRLRRAFLQAFRRGFPGLPGLPGVPGAPGFPGMGFQPQIPGQLPPGWMRPPVPYTGLAPRRRYMRCVSWPGPPGLVPTSAAMTPQPAQAAIVAAATAPLGRRGFRVRRRR